MLRNAHDTAQIVQCTIMNALSTFTVEFPADQTMNHEWHETKEGRSDTLLMMVTG